MTPVKTTSKGTQKQARFRQLQAEMGLKPLQVFVRDHDRPAVRQFVAALNRHHVQSVHSTKDYSLMTTNWSAQGLFDALAGEAASGTLEMHLTLAKGDDPTIEAVLPTFGDLPLQIAVTGEEIRVATHLCDSASITDHNAFNAACLRLNPTISLSNIGLVGGEKGDSYVIYGQLSARSPLGTVLEEIEILGHNAIVAAAELRSFIN
jgi:uncharacterized protein YjfI (DUF2170 family)